MSQPSFKVAFQLTFQRLSTASRREGSEMITSTKQRKLSGLMMLKQEKKYEKLLKLKLCMLNGKESRNRGVPWCSFEILKGCCELLLFAIHFPEEK